MPIDRKAYKADKKKYKSTVKANNKGEKSDVKANNAARKSVAKQKQKDAKFPDKSGMSPGYSYVYTRDQYTPTMDPGNEPKRSDYKKDFNDNENIGRGGKGPKPMSKTRRAKASLMQLKDGLVSRFQSSTPKIGKNELMKPVLESLKPMAIKVGPKETPSRLPNTKIRSYDFDGTSMKQQSASPSPKPKKKT
jgi:hypothetical protein